MEDLTCSRRGILSVPLVQASIVRFWKSGRLDFLEMTRQRNKNTVYIELIARPRAFIRASSLDWLCGVFLEKHQSMNGLGFHLPRVLTFSQMPYTQSVVCPPRLDYIYPYETIRPAAANPSTTTLAVQSVEPSYGRASTILARATQGLLKTQRARYLIESHVSRAKPQPQSWAIPQHTRLEVGFRSTHQLKVGKARYRGNRCNRTFLKPARPRQGLP